jgi:hypothetical protein
VVLIQEKDQLWAHLNTVMNLEVFKRWGIFRLTERLLVSPEGIGCVELDVCKRRYY